jgi:DNA-binding response OmpR family regulator
MTASLTLPSTVGLPVSVLIIEPNPNHSEPYQQFESELFVVTRVSGLTTALPALTAQTFQLICCSTSLQPSKLLELLEAAKHASATHLIPIVFVVDLSQRLTTFPISPWAGKMGIVTTHTSPAEWQALLQRLLQ